MFSGHDKPQPPGCLLDSREENMGLKKCSGIMRYCLEVSDTIYYYPSDHTLYLSLFMYVCK